MTGSADEPETEALNDGTKERNAPYRPESIDVGAGRVDTAGDEIDASVDMAAADATLFSCRFLTKFRPRKTIRVVR